MLVRDKYSGEAKPSYFLTVELKEEKWGHDNIDEFLADYRKYPYYSMFTVRIDQMEFSLSTYGIDTNITVGGSNRSDIELIFNALEKHVKESKVKDRRGGKPRAVNPTVFIGHGKSPLWRDLKDHLHDKQKLDVESYESGARAGHVIRDVLEEMLDKSSIAFLVMTGEDQTSENRLRARQNVIHEVGLFQGHLGFSRAIVLLEEGTEEFSNLHGVHQIRFSKGNIKETYGDVLATIKREFS